MKNLKLWSLLAFAMILSFTSCGEDEEVDPNPDTDCPELSFTQDGKELLANFEGAETLEFYAWEVTGESLGEETITENEGTDNQGDNKFSLENLEPGTYTICLVSESTTCTLTDFCKEITIEEDTSNDGCPDLKYTKEGAYLVADFEGIDTLKFYAWNVTGESLGNEVITENEGTNDQGDNKFSLESLEPGTYKICLVSEGAFCTFTEYCEDIVIESDEDDCPALSFFSEGTTAVASFAGINDVAVYEWFVDGQLVETEDINQGRDNELVLGSYDPGSYNVCIKATTEDCPQGVEFCDTVVVREGDGNGGGDDCPQLSFNVEGTTILANFPGINNVAVYEWFVDGQLAETEDIQSQDRDNTLDISSYGFGTFNICIKATTADCPQGVEYCSEVTISEPDSADCSVFDVQYVVVGTTELVDARTIRLNMDRSTVFWSIDGVDIPQSVLTQGQILALSDHITQPGMYQICYRGVSRVCGNLEKCIDINFQGL
ncbi:hypothetical protein [Aquimarina sp. RZ0]|uniref:hypothetical protein n=1 Tax=Aquimarina sp. RZ0 TaxID=2607730 RepID=UPI0011F33F5C|nr:hypothetical protein [Aquimarina sp. RZ0]KAA1246467.1 hypothetical protein F0000_07620 [Aquimarina sp. RZ0]